MTNTLRRDFPPSSEGRTDSVTVKMRTGWDHLSKNGPVIANGRRLGLQAVTMHGRTRCDMYKGDAEYDTIQRTREAIQIPLIANGDITSIQKVREVLCATGADAVMIGRGTQGDPWLPGSSPLNSMVDCYLDRPSTFKSRPWPNSSERFNCSMAKELA